MNTKHLFSTILISTLAFAPAFGIAATNPTNAPTSNQASDKKTQQDAEIIGSLETLNKNEIAASSLAKKHKLSSQVRDFADLMIKTHTDNLKATQNLSKKIKIMPAETDAISSMEQTGEKERADLEGLKEKDFQKGYIDAMVNDHKDALSAIDGYIKKANNALLKAHLEDTRTHVKHHLLDAKKIQHNLPSVS